MGHVMQDSLGNIVPAILLAAPLCDCERGIRLELTWYGERAYPCPECAAGQRMIQAREDAEYELWCEMQAAITDQYALTLPI